MSHNHRPKQPGRMTCPLDQCQCASGDGGTRCRQCSFNHHCGSHDDGCHRACAGPQRARAGFRRFEGYRADQPLREQIGPEDPNHPRFEGVVFSDGTCVIRWGGKVPSTITFTSFTAMMRVHGHPEYGSVIKWLDEMPDTEAPFAADSGHPSAGDRAMVMRATNGGIRSKELFVPFADEDE